MSVCFNATLAKFKTWPKFYFSPFNFSFTTKWWHDYKNNESLNFENPERVIFFFCNFSPSDFYWWAFVLMQLWQSSKRGQSFISAPSTLVTPRSGDMIVKTMNRWILKTLKGWYFPPVILTLLYRKILRWKTAPKSVEKTKHYFQSKEFGTEPNSFFWGYKS